MRDSILENVEGGVFGILALYVNVISSSVGIRKPLMAVMTLRAGYLDARYVRPFDGLVQPENRSRR